MRLVHLHRVAIKIGVGKVVGRTFEIEDGEPGLAKVFAQTCATADDLLEQGHRADVLIQHDEFAGLRVNAGAHKLRRRGDDRKRLFRVNEIVQLALAFDVVARNLHHVTRLVAADVGVGIAEGLSHAAGVINVFAKDDGLGAAIRRLQVFGDALCDHAVTVFQHEAAIHVAGVVDAIFDDIAMLVGHARRRPPAEGVAIDVHADHFVRCEVAVLDALAKAVGVDRFTEIFDVGNFARLFRRSGEADLRRGREVGEDFTPGGIFVGAATVAFVNDDEIEEVRRKLLVNVSLFVGARHGLIE